MLGRGAFGVLFAQHPFFRFQRPLQERFGFRKTALRSIERGQVVVSQCFKIPIGG